MAPCTSASVASITGSRLFFWLQPADERVERERIAVGHGVLFFDQHAEHPRLQQRK